MAAARRVSMCPVTWSYEGDGDGDRDREGHGAQETEKMRRQARGSFWVSVVQGDKVGEGGIDWTALCARMKSTLGIVH